MHVCGKFYILFIVQYAHRDDRNKYNSVNTYMGIDIINAAACACVLLQTYLGNSSVPNTLIGIAVTATMSRRECKKWFHRNTILDLVEMHLFCCMSTFQVLCFGFITWCTLFHP